MISLNVELNSKPILGTSEHIILLRITVNRKHSRLALMYSTAKKHFNPKGKLGKHIRSSHPEHAKINKYIVDKIILAKDIITEFENDGTLITAQSVKTKMIEKKTHDFIKYIDNYILELEKNGNIGTYKKYKAVVNSIKSFANAESLLFEEIDSTYLKRYEAHLKEEGKEQTTIYGYLSKIRSLFNKAINEGHLRKGDNPFDTFKLAKNGQIDHLTPD